MLPFGNLLLQSEVGTLWGYMNAAKEGLVRDVIKVTMGFLQKLLGKREENFSPMGNKKGQKQRCPLFLSKFCCMIQCR